MMDAKDISRSLGNYVLNRNINLYHCLKKKKRLSHSITVAKESVKKHRWGLKRSKILRKRTGAGYKTGTYSAVTDIIPLQPTEEKSDTNDDTDDGKALCQICNGSEMTGVIGKKNSSTDDEWLQCDICKDWSHIFCFRNSRYLLEVPKNELWFCSGCNRS